MVSNTLSYRPEKITTMPDLQNEFNYFLSHQEELVKKYNGKHIVIVGHEIKGAFDDVGLAYEFAVNQFQPGTFLIQHCIPGESAYSQTFHSRAIFA